MDKYKLEELNFNLHNSFKDFSLSAEQISQLKKTNRNVFLQFVSNLRTFTENLDSYISEIRPELEINYTSEVLQEIVNFTDSANQHLSDINFSETEKNQTKIADNEESSEIINNIELYINELKIREKDWLEKKPDLLLRLENDTKNLKHTETEIKKILFELANTRNMYIKNRNILEIHLKNNEQIVNSMNDFTLIREKINFISMELNSLDNDIKKILLTEQSITEKIINQPYTID